MRIAHVTTVHRWDDGRIFERQARSLQRAGHEVFVLAPGRDTRHVDGIEVLPLGMPKQRLDRMTRLVLVAKRSLAVVQPDLVIVHDPELLWLVVRLSMGRARPVLVYDAHEEYSAQIRDKEWIAERCRHALATALGWMEVLASKRADAVLAATPSIAERFPRAKTAVVLNRPVLAGLPDPDPPLDFVASVPTRPLKIVYVGDLRDVRGAHSLVDAMACLDSVVPPRLTIAGRLSPSSLEEDLRQSPGWSRVEVLGWLGKDDLNRLLEISDVAVLPFLPARNHIDSQPNKLFEYLVMGLPIVMSSFRGWIEVAQSVGAEFETFTPGIPSELARAIERITDRSYETPRSARAKRARESLGWEHIVEDYVAIIESAAARKIGLKPRRPSS